MTHVLRRKHPRHDGSRYFNDRGPCAHYANEGASFDSADAAEAQRTKLREPHLWEVLPQRVAAERDYQEQKALRERPANPVVRALWPSFAAHLPVRAGRGGT